MSASIGSLEVPTLLSSSTDGTTFAAKARAAELNAIRTQEQRSKGAAAGHDLDEASSPPDFVGVPLSQWLTFKHARGRRPKSLSVAEKQPPASDGCTRTPSQIDQFITDDPHQQDTATNYSIQVHNTIINEEHIRRRPHPATPFPPLFPRLDLPFNSTLPHSSLSPTSLSDCDRDYWASESSLDWNVVDPITMPPRKKGNKGVSPGTPSSDIRQQAPQSARHGTSDDHTKSNPFHDHPATGPLLSTNVSSFPTIPQSTNNQPTSTPQRSSRSQQGITPQVWTKSTSHRSAAAPQVSSMDDPFQDQSGWMSDDFFHGNDAYSQANVAQQNAYGHQHGYLQPDGYHQHGYLHPDGYHQHGYLQPDGYHQHGYLQPDGYHQQTQYPQYAQTSHDPKAPYTQQTAYDQSRYGQNPYAQQYTHDNEQFLPQQAQYNHHQGQNAQQWSAFGPQQADYSRYSNPRTAVQMPPAVKGTPSYDVRIAVLQSQANENFLKDFYKWTEQKQQDYLNHHFGAVDTLSTSAHDHKHTKNVPSSFENQPPVRRSQQAAVVPHIRDPAPYTGFGAGNKKDVLFQHPENVTEKSKAQAVQSGTPRTVLHDPVANQSVNRSTSTATTTTLKPQVPNFQPRRDPPPQPAQIQSAQYQQDLLESSEALPSTHSADDSTSPTYHITPSNSKGNFGIAPFSHRIIEAFERMKRPDALDLLFDRIQQTHDNLEAGKSPYQGSAHGGHLEAQKSAQDTTQSTTATGARHSGAPAEMMQVQYTATGHPIPHGGFSEFKTPYDKHFMGSWRDFPEPFASQAARTSQLQFLAKEKLEDHAFDLPERVPWFRANSLANDLNLQTVVAELKSRSEQASVSNIATAGDAKPLLSPIGHERSAASKQAAGTTNVIMSDLMKNPSAQDGIDLMSGTITNLAGYANGNDIGGHFTNWARPAEHAIDKSFDGNKSVFDKNWGTPPARVGRDPRYQQTMTTDGRATYFEDPARGKSRQ